MSGKPESQGFVPSSETTQDVGHSPSRVIPSVSRNVRNPRSVPGVHSVRLVPFARHRPIQSAGASCE
jgi:hypothetical protein